MSYKPVTYDPKIKLEKDLEDPSFRLAWEVLGDEFAALDALLTARQQAGMTQEQVAAKMGVSQPSLARVEAALGSHRHSPSLEMLRKYASAVNCKLEIRLIPQHS